MNKKFRKLVDCPEIQDRYFPADDTPKSLGIDGVYYPSLEWLMNECEKEIMKKFNWDDEVEWWIIDNYFALYLDCTVKKYEYRYDRKTAWAEYLLRLIRGGK